MTKEVKFVPEMPDQVRLYLTMGKDVLATDLEGHFLSEPQFHLLKSHSASDPNISESDKIKPGHVALKYHISGGEPIQT